MEYFIGYDTITHLSNHNKFIEKGVIFEIIFCLTVSNKDSS
jgi:hypothetical protein